MRIDGKLRIGQPATPCPPQEPSELSDADEHKAGQIAERAFGLFRKLVPREPFAIHILNLHVQYDEPLAPTQCTLKFASRDANTAPMVAAGEKQLSVGSVDRRGLATVDTAEEDFSKAARDPRVAETQGPFLVDARESLPSLDKLGVLGATDQPSCTPACLDCDCEVVVPPVANMPRLVSYSREGIQEDSLSSLIAMGFSAERARDALSATSGDMPAAVEHLLRRTVLGSSGSGAELLSLPAVACDRPEGASTASAAIDASTASNASNASTAGTASTVSGGSRGRKRKNEQAHALRSAVDIGALLGARGVGARKGGAVAVQSNTAISATSIQVIVD